MIDLIEEDSDKMIVFLIASLILLFTIWITSTASLKADFKTRSFKQNYQITTAKLEIGEELTSPSNLNSRDYQFYEVSSVSNRVSWSTKLTLDQEKTDVRSIVIDYTGKTSASCPDIWLSLYNNHTSCWEVVSEISLSTANTHKQIVLSHDLSRFITDHRDMKIRLSGSNSSSFTLQTDFLSVTIYAKTIKNVITRLPESYDIEQGTLIRGKLESLKKKDNNAIAISSDSKHQTSVQIHFNLPIAANRIHTLTVTLNTKDTGSSGSTSLSLLNYQTKTFDLYKMEDGLLEVASFSFTLLDQLEIANYISEANKFTLRIANSSSSPFTKEIDFGEVLIEVSENESFTIAQISDIHELIGHEHFLAIIDEINRNNEVDFTIITGDVTDHGTPAQYDLYCQDIKEFKNPVYTLPGNHDNRWWNANGKNDYIRHLGPLYQSFNYKGIHFVLLDTSVNFELDEKINKVQQEWLINDLSLLPKEMPIIFFGHHPFFIHNNVTGRDELFRIAEGYNLIGYLSGHMHFYENFIENGIPIIIISYIKDNAKQEYVTIRFTSRTYYIYKHQASTSSKELWLTGTMVNTRKPTFTIEPLIIADNGNVTVTTRITDAPDAIIKVQARIDNYGPYTPLTNIDDNTWQATIDISAYQPSIPYGHHFIGVEVFDENNYLWANYRNYEYSGGSLTTKWIFTTNDLIQSTPTYDKGTVYVGSYDHHLYAIDDETGLSKWSFKTGDSIISKPVIYQKAKTDYVLFGSNDKHLYCLQSQTGKLVWKYQTKGSVMSDPIIEQDMVIFGSGDGHIYAIDVIQGKLIWSYQVEGLMRQQPLVQKGILYAFVRNTYIWYALNVNDGTLVWRGNANTNESYFVCGDVRPVIAGGKLWCIDAQNFQFGHLDIKTGALVWTASSIEVSSRGMATDGINIYYVANGGREIYALNTQTYREVWHLDLRCNGADSDLQPLMIDCGIIYDKGRIIHVAERGRITIIDANKGCILHCYDAVGYPERVFWSTPEVANNKIYISGIDGKVYSISYPD